jgi:predicted nucleic acid-binding protein
MIKVFIDATGWHALVNKNHTHHQAAREYFQTLLDSNAKLYTNVLELNTAITEIKKECDLATSIDFSKIIEESSLSASLNISWYTRRMRRAVLKHFFSIKDPDIDVKHCAIFEDVRKKKINFIFSFDDHLKKFGIPLMPQA